MLTLLTLFTFIVFPHITAAAPVAAVPSITPALGQKRCGDGDCIYGGTATTLTAPTVTTTILSVTSVPCYITTYVTDSTTTTSTVYSTEVQTSTITRQGTVTVIKYQPTPILKSSEYTSVLEITQTATSYWTETEGTASETTITGSVETIVGTVGTGGDYSEAYTTTAEGKTTASAWTHAAANAQPTDGWAGAAATGGVAGATTTGLYSATTGTTGVTVNWGGAVGQSDDTPTFLAIGLAVVAVVALEAWWL